MESTNVRISPTLVARWERRMSAARSMVAALGLLALLLAAPTAASASHTDSLKGVSCWSSEGCEAVGSYKNGSGVEVTLAEGWNVKKTWSTQETPNPAEAKGSSLKGVSCWSSEGCEAVGSYKNGSGVEVTLAEGWNGKAWSTQGTPNPAEAKGSSLKGVSCWSSEGCKAVGSFKEGSGKEVSLAESWDGKAWATQETPVPSEAKASSLTSVSCWSGEGCKAVGSDKNSTGTEVTLAVSWNGKAWSSQETPNPVKATGSVLRGVTCWSAEGCESVGSYTNSLGTEGNLTEKWTKEWTVSSTRTPEGAKASRLVGVFCKSGALCNAVGSDTDSLGAEVPLAENREASEWHIESPPSPKEAKASSLASVSCWIVSQCEAVGSYTNGAGEELTLAERSSLWSIQETPNP